MQTLIDQTIERCAEKADNGWVPSYVHFVPNVEEGLSDWKPGSPWDRGAVDACERIGKTIRALKSNPTDGGKDER